MPIYHSPVDITQTREAGDLPCCPICDNEIRDCDPHLIVLAHQSLALAHQSCAEEEANQ